MPSLFSKSRSRTVSTPQKKATSSSPLDEFGILRSAAGTPTSRKQKDKQLRAKTLSTHTSAYVDEEQQIPDGTFLPFHNGKVSRFTVALQEPYAQMQEPVPVHTVARQDYGYLSIERHVVLSLPDCAKLVDVLAEELGSRGGLTTPFLFSSAALDISMNAIKRLIHAFVASCEDRSKEAKWREEARFTGMHELAMCLRWGLARVIRIIGGREVRGFFEWEYYNQWREQEIVNSYPDAHFATFLPPLPREVQGIFLTTLSLLTRLTAHSSSSGHTPPTLSPLFGPLFFGLGAGSMFGDAYERYLASTNAMEHLLLAFIRWQDRPGGGGSMGVPTRLKQWIKGYPAMLPRHIQSFSGGPVKEARKGVRTVRVMSVRRNSRMYSPDLVKTGSTWSRRGNSLYSSKEWERIAPPTLKLTPRYAETYKRKMAMPSSSQPQSEPVPTSVGYGASMSTNSSQRSDKSDYFSGPKEGEDRFRSLTDLKWGNFEDIGFGGLGVDEDGKDKLKFDLTESARSERKMKRETLGWADFATEGFTRTDAPLSATLQFSPPINTTINSFPEGNIELNKKLKKAQKSAPTFGWDTEPVIGGEEVVEEAFIDVFCDLIYGSGWSEDNHGLGSDITDERWLGRECNWALVEYKSLPPNTRTVAGNSDPRSGSSVILFEEFVPLEYRQQLASQDTGARKRLPSLFGTGSSSKSKWKPAPTLNGRPYVIGHVPSPRTARERDMKEREFEGILSGGNETRVLSLGGSSAKPPAVATPRPTPTLAPTSPFPERTISNGSTASESKASPSKSKHPLLSPLKGKKSSIPPAEYSTLDFETRLASYSDEENSSNGGRKYEEEHEKQKRRESKDDAWVDILVGTAARRMGNQDAVARRQDPEAVSLEVAQALAGVPRDGSISPLSHEPPISVRASEANSFVEDEDEDVDEVERVPRSAEQSYIDSLQDETDDEDVEDALASIRAQQPKRPSYFDLHPDRKRPVSESSEEPRDQLKVEEPVKDVQSSPTKPASRTLSTSPVPPSPSTPPNANGSSTTTGGRTAALIEMYRERERASTGATGSPSKLSPMPPAPSPISSPTPIRKTAPEDLVIEPPARIVPDETGRGSPARYIHGAPLHNVLEEEEED